MLLLVMSCDCWGKGCSLPLQSSWHCAHRHCCIGNLQTSGTFGPWWDPCPQISLVLSSLVVPTLSVVSQAVCEDWLKRGSVGVLHLSPSCWHLPWRWIILLQSHAGRTLLTAQG